MIVPGLDRLDGTAVDGRLSDEEWREHTAEVMDLFAEEVARADPENAPSMVEFAAPFARGERTTAAMRRVAAAAVATTTTTAAPDPAPQPAPTSHGQAQAQKWNPDAYARKLQAARGPYPEPDSPGLVLAAGCQYPFKSPAVHAELKRFASLVKARDANESLYFSPLYATHVTVATPLKFNTWVGAPAADVAALCEGWTRALRESAAVRAELKRGPIRLIARRLELRGGNAIVLLFDDVDGRFPALRDVVAKDLAGAGADLSRTHIPDIVHTSVARVTREPTIELQNELAGLMASWNPVEVEIDTLDLVLERTSAFFHGFPEDVLWHAEFGSSGLGDSRAQAHSKGGGVEVVKPSPGAADDFEDEPSHMPMVALSLFAVVAAVVAGYYWT